MDVVKASKRIMPILVDCDWGKKNNDISSRYEVRGYPTVVFTDPRGKELSRLRARSPEAVVKEISSLASAFRGRSAGPEPETKLVWAASYDKAFASAKKDSKLLLVLFTDGSKNSNFTEASLAAKSLTQTLGQFVIVRAKVDCKSEVCKKHRVTSGSALHVIDPSEPDPYKKPLLRLTGKRTAQSLGRSFESVLRRVTSD